MPFVPKEIPVWIIILLCLFAVDSAKAWKQCSEESGGGQCPELATCCPTETPGLSSCITSQAHAPDSQGVCCGENTGCGYGYECAVRTDDGSPYCKLMEDHPLYLTNDVPRYELCTVPQDMQDYDGFAIETAEGTHQLAYFSNMGSIDNVSGDHLLVEDVLIMVHGSSRNADDYFCAALSIAPSKTRTLVIAPRFAAMEDDNLLENQLVWAEKRDEGHFLPHSWRYGADALNAPVSSYETLDLLVEYLAQATVQYPNLQRISVAGHSAGGQVAHRWALLSNSPVWDLLIDVRAIVANPRSFCYLDGRRMDDNDNFNVPSPDDTALCPGYDQWQWGLEPGGKISCPYKDRALAEAPKLKERYASRRVVYLSGEYDTESKPDQCETSVFQGKNRRERSERYFQALEAYFGQPVHERHVVPRSPHDHFLMFQSDEGRNAIFGRPDNYEVDTWDDY
jgi:pimeloyl-ACP methyl ester carboxylesterase